MQDTNWFYSSLAQSAAAIIGIISAIIISRIMMFSSEKQGIQSRINELESEIFDLEFQMKNPPANVKLDGIWQTSIKSLITSKQNIVIGLDEKNEYIYLPKHIKFGIIILIFSSIVSVILPLLILLLSNSDTINLYINHLTIGGIILILFFFSMALIFLYIFLEIGYLHSEFDH